MGNIWRLLSDVTYPIVAYTTVRLVLNLIKAFNKYFLYQGHEFNRSLYKVLHGCLSVILMLTYLSVSLSMTYTSRICGCLTSVIPRTSSLPVWRSTKQAMHGDSFVRWYYHSLSLFVSQASTFKGASMTLVGLLPPLCDNGKLLVDGGYSEFSRPSFPLMPNFLLVDNLPVSLLSFKLPKLTPNCDCL